VGLAPYDRYLLDPSGGECGVCVFGLGGLGLAGPPLGRLPQRGRGGAGGRLHRCDELEVHLGVPTQPYWITG
jgi:hypothetical protein